MFMRVYVVVHVCPRLCWVTLLGADKKAGYIGMEGLCDSDTLEGSYAAATQGMLV